MKNSLIWGAIALSPAFAYADYQFEAIGGYGQVDTTTTVNTFGPIFVGGTVVFTDRIKQEADIHQIGGRLHFDTVSTKVGPLAEAAFLGFRKQVRGLDSEYRHGGRVPPQPGLGCLAQCPRGR